MKKLNVLLLVAAIIGALGCNKDSDDDNNQSVQRAIEYSIECEDCYVAYYKSGGQQLSEQNVATGWKYSFDAKKGDVVFIAAMNAKSEPAMVGATIKLNGQVYKTDYSHCAISGTVIVTDTLD